MKRFRILSQISVILFTAAIMAGTALAEKPPWVGGKDGKNRDIQAQPKAIKQGEVEYLRVQEGRSYRFFTEDHRAYIQDHYVNRYHTSRGCPPGLAKKRNGCMPPGQTKKWQIGKPLPRDVIFYDLPPIVLAYLGPPPSRHRFVRVAQDILLITIGVGIVVDAIENLRWELDH